MRSAIILLLVSTAASAAAPCERPGRHPLNVVLAYDGTASYKYARPQEGAATADVLAALCPGDAVRVATFGEESEWLGAAIRLAGPSERQQVADMVRSRPQLRNQGQVHQRLVDAVSAHWDRGGLAAGEVPMLIVFTDHGRSEVPRGVKIADFEWEVPPAKLRGALALVTVRWSRPAFTWQRGKRRPGPMGPPEVTVRTLPQGADNVPANGPVTAIVDALHGPMQFGAPAVVAAPVEAGPAETAPPKLGLTSWIGLGAGIVLLGLFGMVVVPRLRMARGSRRMGPRVPSPEVMVLLWDKSHSEVIRQETRRLDGPVKVGAAASADIVVPGPFAMELRAETGEPVISSANSLGFDVRRRAAIRPVRVTETPVVLRPGDRVDLGGGHEVEFRF